MESEPESLCSASRIFIQFLPSFTQKKPLLPPISPWYSIVVYSPLDCYPDEVKTEKAEEHKEILEFSDSEEEEEDEESKAEANKIVKKQLVEEIKHETLFSKYDIRR